MGVSYEWLKEYIACPWSAEELASRLTLAGIAIDQVENLGDDQVMELDLTPNRGDCLGMIHLAYEVAALCGESVRLPEAIIRENHEQVETYMRVRVEDPKACPRFTGRIIKNIKIGPSPEWMQRCLSHSGIRPINNVVDITNYVMLEMNQPLHAYDYDFFAEKEIVVRSGFGGDKFITLDGAEHILESQDLLITEAGKRPVGLAGIMGGGNSQVLEDTKMVFLEAAHFERTGIRKTSRRMSLRSDSSVRFEKGCDINGVVQALNRAAYLIQELAAGEVVGGILDVYPQVIEEKTILLRPDRVNKLLGLHLFRSEIEEILARLPLKVVAEGENLRVIVPTYRLDLEMEVDLIEEIARLYGYERIPSSFPTETVTAGGTSGFQAFCSQLKDILAESMQEVINYSFISPGSFEQIRLMPEDPLRDVIYLANPLSEEQSVMRTLLLPGMLEVIQKNATRRNDHLMFFELGNVFVPSKSTVFFPKEMVKLAGALSGRTKSNWLKHDLKMDFYYAKGILESVLARFGIHAIYSVAKEPYYHPGRSAIIHYQDNILGAIGEIHPEVMKNYGLKNSICYFELDVTMLYQACDALKTVHPFSKFPAVERDLAVLVATEVPVQMVTEMIRALEIPNLREINLFDVYVGEQVPAGQKSIAINFVFQSYEETLTDKAITASMEMIKQFLNDQLSAQIRIS